MRVAGLASQRSSSIAWDRETGEALSPVFGWQDRRAAEWVGGFEADAAEVRRRCGLPLSPHYGAGKLRWLLDRGTRASKGRFAFGPLASFLVARLCEERPFVAEPHTAARTQLLNVEALDWDPWLLDLFDLPGEVLPALVPTVHPFGTIAVGGQRIPLVAVNGDQAASLFAAGTPAPEAAYVNAGTGAFVQRVADGPPDAPRLLAGIVHHEGEDRLYALEGTVNGAAAALADDVHLAECRDPPLFLNGIGGLGSPFWVSDFESRFVGEGDAAARTAAVVESIAFLLRANLEEMETVLPSPTGIRLSGGLSRLTGFAKLLADVTALPVHTAPEPEATARGIARLAQRRVQPVRPGAEPGGLESVPSHPGPDSALSDRYDRFREILREETGV